MKKNQNIPYGLQDYLPLEFAHKAKIETKF